MWSLKNKNKLGPGMNDISQVHFLKYSCSLSIDMSEIPLLLKTHELRKMPSAPSSQYKMVEQA